MINRGLRKKLSKLATSPEKEISDFSTLNSLANRGAKKFDKKSEIDLKNSLMFQRVQEAKRPLHELHRKYGLATQI